MNFKFVHAADLHIGAPLHRIDIDNKDEFKDANFKAFSNIIDYCCNPVNDIKFLILSGDVFDSENNSRDVGRIVKFREELRKLQIPVYLAYGNHDAKDRWYNNYLQGDGLGHVKVFSDEQRFFIDESTGSHIYGYSYPSNSPKFPSLADVFPTNRDRQECFNIGVLHTDLKTDGPYFPCTSDDMNRCAIDYWALGHKHTKLGSLREKIFYPGTLQCNGDRDFYSNNKEDFGAWIITVDGNNITNCEHKAFSHVKWKLHEIEIQQNENYTEATLLENARSALRCVNAPTIYILKLTGMISSPIDFLSIISELQREFVIYGVENNVTIDIGDDPILTIAQVLIKEWQQDNAILSNLITNSVVTESGRATLQNLSNSLESVQMSLNPSDRNSILTREEWKSILSEAMISAKLKYSSRAEGRNEN